MVKVKFLPSGKIVEVPYGSTILQGAAAAGVQVQSTCGGKGTCGKCQVQLLSEEPTPSTHLDRKFISEGKLTSGWVLACQHVVTEDVIINLEEQKDAHDRKIGFDQEMINLTVVPRVEKHFLTVPKPKTGEQSSDWERLLSQLPTKGVRFNRKIAATLPKLLRQADYQVTAVLDGEELLTIEAGDTTSRSFGLAIDIGTTTIVAHLIEINKGSVVASGAVTNPQNIYGADVIARITHAASGLEGLQQLQEKVISGLNEIIEGLKNKTKVKPEEIYQAVVVGNTTMSHLLLGIDPTYLAPAPFVPAFRQGVEVEAREIGLNILGAGKVVVLPIIAGYVGSDTVGVMLTAKIDQLQGINLIVDIGTNGEIVLVGKDRILTCSTAAGPAFEGAEIKQGMRAAGGAIEGVRIENEVELEIIGGGKSRGICGSGLVDAIYQMYKVGILDASGRIVSSEDKLKLLPPLLQQRIRKGNQGMEFVLAWGKDTVNGDDIILSQKDVREMQLAKGAIMAGIRVLMKEMGITPEEIDNIFLAGAFGNYIRKESALGIGLIPSVPLERVSAIGNAAGEGAKRALLSSDERQKAEKLAMETEYLELSIRADFQEEFISSLSLG